MIFAAGQPPAAGRELRRHYRHSEPSAITWLGWHHCPRWHSTGGCPELQLHVHAVGWPTAQAGIMCLCLAWATPMDMAIASSATEQVFSMSRPPCAAKTLLYRAAKFLGNRSACFWLGIRSADHIRTMHCGRRPYIALAVEQTRPPQSDRIAASAWPLFIEPMYCSPARAGLFYAE